MPVRYQHLIAAVDKVSENSKKQKPLRIMEIGVFDGAHGLQMINRASKNGRTHVEYYGFDMFEDMTPELNEAEVGKKSLARSYSDVYKYLRSKSKAKVISLFKGDTKASIPKALPKLPKMDIIFVDGGHSLGTVQSDFEHAIKLAHEKTIILLDDYYPGDFTKGCAFLVEHDLKSRSWLSVEVLEPEDVYADSGMVVKFVKVIKTAEPSNDDKTPVVFPEVVLQEAPKQEEQPTKAESFQAESCDSNTDVQPDGLLDKSCEDGPCKYSGQPCDGGGRCESRVESIHLELPTAGPSVDTQVSQERQEHDEKLELGTVESKGTGDTDVGSDEQRRAVSDELVQPYSASPPEQSRRSRRSRNKRSGSQAEATGVDNTPEVQGDGQPELPGSDPEEAGA